MAASAELGGSLRYEELVQRYGFSVTHRQIVDWVPERARVLDVGCSSGYLAQLLIETKHCRVTGIEADRAAAERATARGLSVLVGSLEDPEFLAAIPTKYDAIIAADVLEHLARPDVLLAAFDNWLEPGGTIIVSVPNVAAWEIRRGLFFGRFEYQDSGILDRTHLHFFTWPSLCHSLERHGYRIDEVFVEGSPFRLPTQLLQTIWTTARGRQWLLPGRLFAAAGLRLYPRFERWFIERYPNMAPHFALRATRAGHTPAAPRFVWR